MTPNPLVQWTRGSRRGQSRCQQPRTADRRLVVQVYITESPVPELAGLTKAERRAVRQQATALLLAETRWPIRMPVLLCALGGLVGSFAGADAGIALAGHLSPGDKSLWDMLGSMGGVGVCGAGGGYLGRAWLLYRLRPYLRRILKDDSKLAPAE